MTSEPGRPRGELLPPPMHPLSPSAPPSPNASSSRVNVLPPALPPRPSRNPVPPMTAEDTHPESDPESPTRVPTPTISRDEERLSDVQLRELYDDEEIDRFLHLFSTYVREVRVAEPATPLQIPQVASASAPVVPQPGTPTPPTPALEEPQPCVSSREASISERIALDLILPLLPAPRPAPPDFTLGRLTQTSQRLYVAVEPIYSQVAKPLLKLATWKDPKTSFAYCALYWILWYHGLIVSGVILRVLYDLGRWKLHPYPTPIELRDHRSRINRSQTFGTILSTRLAGPRALGLRDVWDLFGDYRHLQKLNKMTRGEAGAKDSDASDLSLNVSFSTPDLTLADDQSLRAAAEEEADLKRLGLFVMNEMADLLERIKNLFLWRRPGASLVFGVVLLGGIFLGLLPARYLMRLMGLAVGAFFWHIIPVIAAIPPSERNRIPPPLRIVPTDTEYAMDLISQRVARGLPVRPKRRRPGRRTSESSASMLSGAAEQEAAHGGHGSTSSSVDWNKWGQRIVSTKERAGEMKQMFQDGQWKQAESWKVLNPLAPIVVAPQRGSEPRIETQTFPAQLRQNPGLITLTQTTVFFTPLFSSRPSLTIELPDVTAVKKTVLTKGIDVHYTQSREDGTVEQKEANFMLVASRSELFARLVTSGGKKWAKVL